MDNRLPFIDRRQRGAVSSVTVFVVVIVVALAVAAWFLIVKPYRDASIAETPAPAAAQKTAAANVAPPANVDALSVDQLLAEARTAMNEQRLVAPAGNNAFEFYMKVLQKQPGNPVAADALRETFSYGSAATEQTINQRDFSEAQREIDLLAKAGPENYTLTILRSKLDAQRKTLDREQQQALDAQKAQQVAQQNAAANQRQQAEQAAAAIEAQRTQAAREQAARVAQAQQAVPVATPVSRPAAAPAAAAEGGAISDAVLIRQVNPRYPTAAMRANQEGWVDVELTVGPDGHVANVTVVDAQPKHIFDRSAIDAVSRWEYKAATRNGEPMTVTLRRRLQFNLGR